MFTFIAFESHDSQGIYNDSDHLIIATLKQWLVSLWTDLLEQCYPSYTVEVNAFLESLEIASSYEILIKKFIIP